MFSNLVGQYQTDKSDLVKVSENLHLVIGTRQKPTPQKPKNYLLQRINPKQHIYISSLYEVPVFSPNEPTAPLQAWSFDWQGKNYQLTIDHKNSTATISLPTLNNSTFSINNVELGAKFNPNAGI